eukprot:5829603-Alexandrium_andersonii.AAC.1
MSASLVGSEMCIRDSDLLRGPEGTTGGAALDRAIEAVAQAGLANRRNTERAVEEVHRVAQPLHAREDRRRQGDLRAKAALRAPLWNDYAQAWGG